eukprot:806866_1
MTSTSPTKSRKRKFDELYDSDHHSVDSEEDTSTLTPTHTIKRRKTSSNASYDKEQTHLNHSQYVRTLLTSGVHKLSKTYSNRLYADIGNSHVIYPIKRLLCGVTLNAK